MSATISTSNRNGTSPRPAIPPDVNEGAHQKCGQECKQVIAFSHDPYFLKHLPDSLSAGEAKCLQLSRIGVANTAIEPWDIEKETKDGHLLDHAALTLYFQQGSKKLRDIALVIRPVLQGYSGTGFRDSFKTTNGLRS